MAGSVAMRALLRKEVKELYFSKGQARIGLGISVVLALAMGAGAAGFMAVLHGAGPGAAASTWVLLSTSAGIALSVIGFLGVLGPLSAAGETLAGERERHTLETLLAHPVTQGDLLGAKVLAQLAPAWISTAAVALSYTAVATALVGLAALAAGVALLVIGLVVATVAALFVCGLGLAVSAKAETTRHAQQTMMWPMMPLIILPGLTSAASPSAGLPWVLGFGVLYAVGLGVVGWLLLIPRTRRSYLMSR